MACWFRFRLGYFACVFVCYFLTWSQFVCFIISFCVLVYFLSFVLSLVVSTSARDYLERMVSEMTYSASSDT